MPKMEKSYLTTYMDELSTKAFYKVCFNQERLPITYHNFRHQSQSYPKVNPEIEKDPNPLRSKANFSREETLHLIDVKFNINYQNNQGIIKVRPLLST